jgi:hypothetical protein
MSLRVSQEPAAKEDSGGTFRQAQSPALVQSQWPTVPAT